jgi:2-iminobutanoate/2-iminopropanoate deaminase
MKISACEIILHEIITTKDAPAPIRPYYSQAVKTKEGSLLFISGQTWNPNRDPPAKGDVELQAKITLDHIETLLNAGGGKVEDIVKVNVYLRDIQDLDKIAEVRYEFFKRKPPASTLVEVSKLWHEEVLIEIDAIAVIPEK